MEMERKRKGKRKRKVVDKVVHVLRGGCLGASGSPQTLPTYGVSLWAAGQCYPTNIPPPVSKIPHSSSSSPLRLRDFARRTYSCQSLLAVGELSAKSGSGWSCSGAVVLHRRRESGLARRHRGSDAVDLARLIAEDVGEHHRRSLASQLPAYTVSISLFCLWIPPRNPLIVYRLVLWWLIAIPTIREYNTYLQDRRCVKKVGSFCWISVAICIIELLICIKFGHGLFPKSMPSWLIVFWTIVASLLTMFIIVWTWKIYRTMLRKRL